MIGPARPASYCEAPTPQAAAREDPAAAARQNDLAWCFRPQEPAAGPVPASDKTLTLPWYTGRESRAGQRHARHGARTWAESKSGLTGGWRKRGPHAQSRQLQGRGRCGAIGPRATDYFSRNLLACATRPTDRPGDTARGRGRGDRPDGGPTCTREGGPCWSPTGRVSFAAGLTDQNGRFQIGST